VVDCLEMPLVMEPPFAPFGPGWSEYADLSDLESSVSLRLMPLVLTGLPGFDVGPPPLRSSSFILLSWLWSVETPLLMPALSGCPGWGVCGRESNVYVPVRERDVVGARESGAPVLL
jgi:hypothetical protein